MPTSGIGRWPGFLLWLAAALVLAGFTLPAHAASEEVEEVLALLSTLQGANIDPNWQPDITQNEAMVTALLTAYGSLSDQQRAEHGLVVGAGQVEVGEIVHGISPRASCSAIAVKAEALPGGASAMPVA